MRKTRQVLILAITTLLAFLWYNRNSQGDIPLEAQSVQQPLLNNKEYNLDPTQDVQKGALHKQTTEHIVEIVKEIKKQQEKQKEEKKLIFWSVTGSSGSISSYSNGSKPSRINPSIITVLRFLKWYQNPTSNSTSKYSIATPVLSPTRY
ncbi:hypothetical protein HDV01_002542 [Terramyces sp. JEL0728]|nr:hypothetical protein HDV01_002542 [Terramyces sp. JEL0728]